MLDATTQANIKAWLDNPALAEFHTEINALLEKNDEQALSDAFYTQIKFGTAGIRGKTGLGSARINTWTVGTAAQGLADYIQSQGDEATKQGVMLGSDTRVTSPEFVQLVTDILTSNGIPVYKFNRPPQVGMFSFAVRLHKTIAGVYISASHNPPSDNGLKIYWSDGAQVLPPHDKAITDAVSNVKTVNKNAPNPSLVTEIGEDFDTTYRTRVLHESVTNSRSAKVVYSPFHGTGQYGVLPILREAGFDVTVVQEQMQPDGNFPNVPGGVPNPQNRESNELTAKKVLETGADIGISTDPDADRLGVIIPKGSATVILDGNQTASLLAYFIAQRLKEYEKLPANGFMVRTVVSTALMDAIAVDNGLKIYNDLPVGFKYIGQCIAEHEDFGDEIFIFAGEESFGCLKGSYARDKDASSASLLACEMVSWLKDQGKTVWDLFDEIYAKYGYYLDDLVDIKYEGAKGFAQMAQLMSSLRENPPIKIGEWPVVKVIDYKNRDKNPADMLIFELDKEGKSTVIVRPSGTEPKVKLYIALHGKDEDETRTKSEPLKIALNQLAEDLTKE
jgi:phosphoglucomutase